MSKYKIKDLAVEISQRIDNPKTSGYDKFVGLEHYDSGEVMISRYGKTDNLDSSVKLFQKGDILIARRNVYLRRAGLVDFDGVTSGDSIVVRANDEIIQRLLPFVFNTKEFWDFANQFADGSMSKRLSPKLLMDYETELPDTNDDRTKLADLLWSVFDTMTSYKELIKQSDELVKSRFIEMFDLDALPKKRLDEICKVFADGDWIESKDQSQKGIWLVQTGNVGEGNFKPKSDKKHYVSEDTFERLNCTEIFEGDILISRLPDPVGRACLLPKLEERCITAVDCTIIRLKDYIDSRYFVTFAGLNEYYSQLEITGSTRQRVSRKNLGKVMVPVAPIEEQKEFRKFCEQIDKSKFILQESFSKLEMFYKKIMNQYLKKED